MGIASGIKGVLIGLGVLMGSAIPWTHTSWTQAVELSDGTISFVQVPRLLDSGSTDNAARAIGPIHYFTVHVPEKAGEPLRKVVIQQKQGFDPDLEYWLNRSQAFTGSFRRKGTPVTLADVTHDRKNQIVTVTFNPPVPPETTVTIRLYPIENPRYGGVYLFGITAFPDGNQPYGQFLGHGRFNIYSGGDGPL